MNTELMARVVTALVGIPVLILIIGWGRPWHFSLVVFLVTLGALWEYFLMAFPRGWCERSLGIISGLLISLGLLIPGSFDIGSLVGGVTVLISAAYLFLGGKLEERYNHLGWTLLGILYAGYLVPHLALLYRSSQGQRWVFFVLLVIMTGDTAAYFVGTFLGRNKLSALISPAKTVEGAAGALGAGALAGIVGASLLEIDMTLVEALWLSLLLSLLGQAGDLFESWIKRVFSVKDSGVLLPGHGGLLDRMDSLIFPVVFTTYYLRLLHP